MNSPSAVNFCTRSFPPVHHVDVPKLVHRDPPGHVELPLAGAVAAELHQELPVLGELLHPVVEAVHHIHVLLGVEGKSRGPVDLAVAVAVLTPLAQERAILGEDGDAVQAIVGDIQFSLSVSKQAHGPCELAVSGARAPDGPQVLVVRAYLLDLHPDAFVPAQDVQESILPKGEIHRRGGIPPHPQDAVVRKPCP